MKKMTKKNNKGFSLVELIVVVLIMGIIAVALAPQVMKWVGTARDNSDSNTKSDIKNAVQVAVADAQHDGVALPSPATTFDFTAAGVTASAGNFKTYVESVTGGDYPTPNGGTCFTVTIDPNGKVSVGIR